jgi:hypothetical protein
MKNIKYALNLTALALTLTVNAMSARGDAPPYVFTVEEWFTDDSGQNHIPQYPIGSDLGFYSYNFNVHGAGSNSLSVSGSSQQALVEAWVRNDLLPGSGQESQCRFPKCKF